MNKKLWKIIALVGAGLFLIALIVLTVVVVFFPANTAPEETPRTSQSSNAEPSTTDDSESAEVDTSSSGDESELNLPKIKFTDSGVARMQVTTDPRVAAASAAQVLWSADTTKVKFTEDYVLAAIEMISLPSPDYRGPGDTIMYETSLSDTPVTTDEMWEITPQGLATSTYDPSGWWWLLADQSQFEQFQARKAVVESVPITVFDAAEADKFVGGAWWTGDVKGLTADLKPGATLEKYWVRVETTVTTGAGEQAFSRNPVALTIYCDPPADGGICAAQLLTTKYPESWQLH